MTPQDKKAREILIAKLYRAFPSSQMNLTEGNMAAYVEATAAISIDALGRSVEQFITGKVERNNAFVPSAPELAENARAWQAALGRVADAQAVVDAQALVSYPIGEAPPEGMVALGPMTVDFGSGPIDLRDKTAAEKEEILQNKGLPSGKPGLIRRMKRMGEA